MNVISPSIGRKVWFRPNGTTFSFVYDTEGKTKQKPLNIFNDQALDATVVCVWGDRMVNLLVVDHGGDIHAMRNVEFRQPGDPEPTGMYCEWMPFQVSQAAKTEALEAKVASGSAG